MHYSLEEIETFLTVMELGTVTAAANRMNLSKSVVSKRIADLEANLGTALFMRNAGRITPTNGATLLAERLRPALLDLRAAAESAISETHEGVGLRGRLTISAPMTFGCMHLSSLLARFAAMHPALELHIDYDDRARDLIHEGFDVAIRIGQARDSSLMIRKLCEDQSIPCASPDYIARHGAPQNVEDLRNHAVIGYSHVANSRLWQFAAGGKSESVQINSRISLNNGEAIRDFVAAGLGLGIIPGFICLPEIAKGRMVRILPQLETPPIPIAVVWPPVSPMPMKLRLFIDFVVEALAHGQPWHQP